MFGLRHSPQPLGGRFECCALAWPQQRRYHRGVPGYAVGEVWPWEGVWPAEARAGSQSVAHEQQVELQIVADEVTIFEPAAQLVPLLGCQVQLVVVGEQVRLHLFR